MDLWENTPFPSLEKPEITYYGAKNRISDCTVVIFPGGGYEMRADHEGRGYAEFLNSLGIDAFVLDYRVSPNRFPVQLLDARRGLRFVRFKSKIYGINPNKIAVMGSSAGAHLAALLCNYKEKIEGETDDEIDCIPFVPNAQILCYPVICSPDSGIAHIGSFRALLGSEDGAEKFSADRLVGPEGPQAFIWHTFDDSCVSVINSLKYCEALRRNGVSAELHIFPHGRHGLGLANEQPHVAQWQGLLKNWLSDIGWL